MAYHLLHWAKKNKRFVAVGAGVGAFVLYELGSQQVNIDYYYALRFLVKLIILLICYATLCLKKTILKSKMNLVEFLFDTVEK